MKRMMKFAAPLAALALSGVVMAQQPLDQGMVPPAAWEGGGYAPGYGYAPPPNQGMPMEPRMGMAPGYGPGPGYAQGYGPGPGYGQGFGPGPQMGAGPKPCPHGGMGKHHGSMAKGQCGMEKGHCRMGKGGHGPKGAVPSEDFHAAHMNQMKERLGIAEEQNEAWTSYQETMDGLHKEMAEFMEKMGEERATTENPYAIQAKMWDFRQAHMKAMSEARHELMKSLTPEQADRMGGMFGGPQPRW